ncbi:MAG: VCBS repeat-containing protein [Byssovorax sp.]
MRPSLSSPSFRRSPRSFAALLAFAGVACALPAEASWPMARHDAKRTGAATGTSDITAPVPYWRTYLGGSISSLGMVSADVNGDGKVEVVYVTGGRMVAKLADDSPVWETPPLGIGSIVGLDDVNGDGLLDIVVSASNHAYVFAAATGALEWAEEDGEMGTLGAVRMGDVNGDGRPDVIVQECGCCGVNSGKTGFAYAFAMDFSPSKLWAMPSVACGGSRALSLVDADGQGPLEVLISTYQTLQLLDGVTGNILATTPQLGTWTSVSFCRGVNLDAMPGDELVCIVNSSDLPAVNQRKAYAVKYDPVAKTLLPMWSQVMAPDAGGDMAWVDPIIDLDADGMVELILSSKDAAGTWTTHVLDAATGASLATLPGERIAGAAPVADPTHSLVFTTGAAGLSAWTFVRQNNPAAALAWSLPDRTVVNVPDFARVRTTTLYSRTAVIDLDADGTGDLLASKQAGGASIEAYKATGAMPMLLAEHPFPADIDPLVTWVVPPITKAYPQLAVATNDGYLTIYDKSFLATNADPAQGRPGLRIGGYYAAGAWRDLQRSPVVGSFDGGAAESIVVRDSRGALLRFDPKEASLVSPPAKTWQKTHAFAPAIVAGLDGQKPGIACFGNPEPVPIPATYLVEALHDDGSVIWQQPVETTPFNDVVPANLNGDATPDLVVQWGDPGDVLLRTRGISGTDGTTLWNAAPVSPGSGRQPAGVTVVDWNGDGKDDVLHQAAGTKVLTGVDGTQLAAGGSGDSYFLPLVYDVNGDGVNEVTLQGGFSPARTYNHNLSTTVWVSNDDDRPYPYGAVAVCNGTPVLVEGSWQHPSRLKMTKMGGAQAGTFVTVVLAGGALYADEAAAAAANARMGQLTSATVHDNLSGQGRPSALVGSGDGYLYGLNPCAATLDFTYGFNAAVGEAVYGDTDGDGRDEILVSVADGFLYDLKNAALPPPGEVLDTDPDNGVNNVDIDVIMTEKKLSCAWKPVMGAAAYEVAILNAGGGFVTSPHWINVGNVVSASLSPLALVEGAVYLCAVRALDAMGHASTDAVSDGVTVTAPVMGTGGGGAGGMGGMATTSGTGGSTVTTTGAGGMSGTTSGTGGSSSTGGHGGMGGMGTTTGTTSGSGGGGTEVGGCGCRVGEDRSGETAGWLALLGVVGAMRRRSRRGPALGQR